MLFDETTAGGENAFLQPVSYLFGGVSALGEAGMAVALFFGLARGESTVVVPAYYISMNVMGSLQGLCLVPFQINTHYIDEERELKNHMGETLSCIQLTVRPDFDRTF